MEIYFVEGGIEIVYNYHSHKEVIVSYKKLLNDKNIILELKKFVKATESNLYIGIIETAGLEAENLILDLNDIKDIKYIELEDLSGGKKNFFEIKLNNKLEYFRFTREGFNAIRDLEGIKKYTNTIMFNRSIVDLNKINELFNKNAENLNIRIESSKIKGKNLKNIHVKNLHILDSSFLDKELKIINNKAKKIFLSSLSSLKNLIIKENNTTIELRNTNVENLCYKNSNSKLTIEYSNLKKLISKNVLFIDICNSDINKTIISNTKNVIIKNLFSLPSSKIILANNETVILKIHYESKFKGGCLFLKNIQDLIIFFDIISISVEMFDIVLKFLDKIYKKNFQYNIKKLYIDDQSVTNIFQFQSEEELSNELKAILSKRIKIENHKDIENLVLDIFKIYNKYNTHFPELKNIKNKKILKNFKQNLLKI